MKIIKMKARERSQPLSDINFRERNIIRVSSQGLQQIDHVLTKHFESRKEVSSIPYASSRLKILKAIQTLFTLILFSNVLSAQVVKGPDYLIIGTGSLPKNGQGLKGKFLNSVVEKNEHSNYFLL